VRSIILVGGLAVAVCGLVCGLTHRFGVLVGARFVQGLFIPALTTCLAAYLSGILPLERLNVVMGSYVSATVTGGLGGRLLGGWIHPPLHWRYAFLTASALLLAATWAAVRGLPREPEKRGGSEASESFLALFLRPGLFRTYWVAFGAMFVYSSVFNYLPFYLSGPPFHRSTEFITLLYLTYITGIVMGPAAGSLSNRIGNGGTMIAGALIFAGSLLTTLITSIGLVVLGLIGVCAGFFAIHAAAAGSLNRRLTANRGRANSLYVLLYYLGGATGITLSGYAYSLAGWPGVIALGVLMLSFPLATGIREMR
jgi:YNFM family putative membrane transporter